MLLSPGDRARGSAASPWRVGFVLDARRWVHGLVISCECYYSPMQRTFARVATALVVVAAGVSLVAQPGKAPLDKAAARWVEQTLKKMTLDEKIGQLLVTS